MAEEVQLSRTFVIEADTEHLERMLKEGHTQGFTLYCDEGPRLGGDNTAPSPLGYFALSIGY